ncbi:MAG: SlyX family protein [Deltaproteobacteria bacterium]|nr:SlyX family protein [Deltaproteobacteria bacterium]
MEAELREHLVDLEVKLAYQERLIRDLDALVREFGTRLDKTTRELEQLKQSVPTAEVPMGPANEPPPHY